MIIEVKNFGKIKSAKINVEDYTIFVGNNNSGKTYLMQLIYEVINALASGLTANYAEPIFTIDSLELENVINRWLGENKEKIVLNVFKKKISIDSLKLHFNITKSFSVKKMTSDEYFSKFGDDSFFTRENKDRFDCLFAICQDEKEKSFYFGDSKYFTKKRMQDEMLRYAARSVMNHQKARICIFLPASRSGLMIARPFIFANEVNRNIERHFSDDNNSENEFGLTQPVYDFLRFLQIHKTSEKASEKRSSLISFINENIINGKLKKSENETFYQPVGSDAWLPPSITSSMVNEISPIMQIITSVRDVDYIFYDEIETCQHPTIQIQMARLLNRLVNVGYKMIVSTHSDTMAAAMSNFIALSFAPNAKQKAVQLGYDEKDLLQKDRVHAYQFQNDGDGTVVREIEKYNNLGMGFDFTLFSQATNRVWNDAKVIYGEQ